MYKLSKSYFFTLFMLFSLLYFSSCDSSIVFEKNTKIENTSWHYTDWVSFDVEINDTVNLHELYFNVRNTIDFPFRNLYVFFETEFPDGRIFRDTLECVLADNQGNWTGKGIGSIKSNSFLFRTQVWFPQMGRYQFRMQQAMRTENLKGINDVGIRIKRQDTPANADEYARE